MASVKKREKKKRVAKIPKSIPTPLSEENPSHPDACHKPMLTIHIKHEVRIAKLHCPKEMGERGTVIKKGKNNKSLVFVPAKSAVTQYAAHEFAFVGAGFKGRVNAADICFFRAAMTMAGAVRVK